MYWFSDTVTPNGLDSRIKFSTVVPVSIPLIFTLPLKLPNCVMSNTTGMDMASVTSLVTMALPAPPTCVMTSPRLALSVMFLTSLILAVGKAAFATPLTVILPDPSVKLPCVYKTKIELELVAAAVALATIRPLFCVMTSPILTETLPERII